MKSDRKSYIGKSHKSERSYTKPILIIFLLLLLVFLLYWGVKIVAIRNSPDFDLNKKAAYYFVLSGYDSNPEKFIETGISNKLLLVDGEKRTVNIIDVPATLFISSKKLEISSVSPKDFAFYLMDVLGTKVDYTYVIYQKPEYFKRAGISNIDELIQKYGKRGLRIIDYFTLQKQVIELRPESVITDGALAKLYYVLGKFAIRNYSLPLLTQKPLKITVDGKVYYRTYLDEERIADFVNDFKK